MNGNAEQARPAVQRKTVIVDGPLAYARRRATAARANELGVQVLSLPLAAARLAGGFLRPVESSELDAAIRLALDDGGFRTIESVRRLPGMARAVSATLRRVWDADVSLRERTGTSARIDDLALIELRVRRALPKAALVTPDLRDMAVARVAFAPKVLGSVELDAVPAVAPIWRPLILAFGQAVDCSWASPGDDTAWFTGRVSHRLGAPVTGANIMVEACANPKAEVVEALRWARQLIASGRASPGSVGICSASPSEWDSHMITLAAAAKLPVFLSHGRPALATREGQVCAALADLLINGLSQARVRRFLAYVAGSANRLHSIPWDWWRGIEPDAALHSLDRWQLALDRAPQRADGVNITSPIMDCLKQLNRGIEGAEESGRRLLPLGARSLWERALHNAGPGAIEYSLKALRVPDDGDPNACIAWGPAKHLEGAPRPFVRLMGLTSRHWPRGVYDDPILPANILSSEGLAFESQRDHDRRAFRVITAGATSECVLSFGRRSSEGGTVAISPLLAGMPRPVPRDMGAMPSHAFSETDRLLARPDELRQNVTVVAAAACWRAWHEPKVSRHDGLITPGDSALAFALTRPQSATSLRHLLRDPLSFVWRYALRWRVVPNDEEPLDLDPRAFGDLVHDLLKRTVDILEVGTGLATADSDQIAAALNSARASVAEAWPLKRETPPQLLWAHTLEHACDLARNALSGELSFLPGTRAWTEIAFGWEGELASRTSAPWDERALVPVPGTSFHLQGKIDRLELSMRAQGARVTDYKSGAMQKKRDKLEIGPGDALQRVIYAVAARHLLPDLRRLRARLVYLGSDPPEIRSVPDETVDCEVELIDAEIEAFARRLNAAQSVARSGHMLMGPDPERDSIDYLIAHPADIQRYKSTKRFSINKTIGSEFSKLWGLP
jgi:hypothetical protein